VFEIYAVNPSRIKNGKEGEKDIWKSYMWQWSD
jgi:hypothetical protein